MASPTILNNETMIYYNGEFVDYRDNNNKGELESKLRSEIHDIDQKYFGKTAQGFAIVRFPKGKRIQDEVTGTWYPVKPFPTFHKSADRMWIFSRTKKTSINGRENYGDAFTIIRDPYKITKKDIEFLWFLLNHSSDVKAGLLQIEDKEAMATKEAKEFSSDVDIRYLIYGKTSPIGRNEELFRKIASVFGIKDVERHGFNQLKNIVYGIVSEGENSGSRFINFDVFEKLVNGHQRLRLSFIIREAISDGSIKFNQKDYKWYFASGGELIEPLFTVSLKDLQHKEELLIEAAILDLSLKGAILSALGRADFENVDELREFNKQTLMSMTSRYGLDVTNKDNVESLVEKICGKFGIEYKAKST